jgi:phage tail P2-like protein
MIPASDHLLPIEVATPLEQALAAVGTRTDAICIDWQAFLDPMRTPVEFLPLLAHAFSVDIWNPKWPEHKQRRVVADAVYHHRIKGTLAGLEAYAAIVDSEVIRAITPPGTFFLSGGMSEDQRAALADRMPQIRIYRRAVRASAGQRMFLSARAYSAIGGSFVADSRAGERTQPRITFMEDGLEQPINVEEITDIIPGLGYALYERALLRRKRRPGVAYCGRPLRFLVRLDHSRSLASFRRTDGAPSVMRYGMRPASVQPEAVYQRGAAGRAFFFGRPLYRRFWSNTQSDTRVYERIVIWDPDLVPRRRGASYLGVSRFGVAPYTGELVVHIPSKRPRRALLVGGYLGMFLAASSGEKYRETLRALRAAKAVRDRIYVNTTTFRSPQAGQLIVAGTPVIAGRLLRS